MRRMVSMLAVLLPAAVLLTACATSSESPPAVTPAETATEVKTTWDLVFFSDSSGWGVADLFAEYIEEDLDVAVDVRDLSGPGLSAGTVLAALRGEDGGAPLPDEVTNLVREAEVVVVCGNPLESISENHPSDWNCVSSKAPYVRDCAPETFEAYRADLVAIYREIHSLRGDAPILIRAFDAYNPLYSVYREHGVYDACVDCWENYNEAIHQAAAAQNVPVAHVFDAFNGPDHGADPRDRGYIRDDGEHTTTAGREVIAQALRELGYEPGGPVAADPEPTALGVASDTPAAAALIAEGTWNMVVLGDSLLAEGYGVLPEAYAAHIEEDLGVKVEIENLAIGGETSMSLLANVQKYPWYREPIEEAEVILISAGGGDITPRLEKRFFGGECGGGDNQDCLREQLDESRAAYDALLTEIASLASPERTIIRPITPTLLGNLAEFYDDRPEDVEVFYSYTLALYEHMATSSAELGIPILDLYQMYEGPDADPSLPEITDIGDGVHVSDEGDAVIAGLLRELGYDPVNP